MLSKQEINGHMRFLSSEIEALAAGDRNLPGCIAIDERFRALRDQYRQQPDTLGGCIGELSQLSKRFDALLGERLTSVVDRFNEVSEQVHRAEQEKAFWRDFLIRNAVQAGQERLHGTTATVRVRSMDTRKLPAAGVPERDRLEELIRASGCWEQVTQLSRPRLQRALAQNLFDKPQADAIEQLCPTTVTYQVTSHSLDNR